MNSNSIRRRYRSALADLITEGGFALHVTASVRSNSQRVLEGHLRHWVARIDRLALGRNWASPDMRKRRMKGYVFFETGKFRQRLHAHMLLLPPQGYHRLRFAMTAPHLFRSHPAPIFRPFYGKPVVPNGTMHVQLIGRDREDILRVAYYDTKELTTRDDAVLSWKFIEDLTAFRP